MNLMKYFLIFIAVTIIAFNVDAAVLKHEVSTSKNYEFNFREMCEAMGSKNLELISAKSMTELDCMGKFFKIIDFCLSKFPLDKNLTRGIIDNEKKKIICETSTSVMISVSCDSRDVKYCLDPKKGCEELRKIYAYKLEVAHYSKLEKNINCYFSKTPGDSLNEL